LEGGRGPVGLHPPPSRRTERAGGTSTPPLPKDREGRWDFTPLFSKDWEDRWDFTPHPLSKDPGYTTILNQNERREIGFIKSALAYNFPFTSAFLNYCGIKREIPKQ